MDALIFDLDGTLVDSAPDLQVHTNALLAAYGRAPLDLATVTSFVGYGAAVLLGRAFAATGAELPAAELAEAVRQFSSQYRSRPVVHTRPMPHVPEVLAELADRYTLAVCTNKPEAPARAVLEAIGLADRFAVVIGGDTLPVRKPDPAPLLAAVPLGARRAALVGDTEIDGATAAAAGMPFYWFTRGYHHRVPDACDASFADWRDLPSLLR